MRSILSKECVSCKIKKPYSEFYKTISEDDGHSPECKECMRCKTRAVYIRNRDYIRSIKKGSSCADCGEDNINKMTFHHRDPSEKFFTISQPSGRSFEMIDEEIKKCDILCRDCHDKKHIKPSKLNG